MGGDQKGMDRHIWEASPGGAYVNELEDKACARSQFRARGLAQVGGFGKKRHLDSGRDMGMGGDVGEGI